MLNKSAQNRLISSKICTENSHEISHFLPIGEVSTENFSEFVSENPLKFDFFFFATYQKPCSMDEYQAFLGEKGKDGSEKGTSIPHLKSPLP